MTLGHRTEAELGGSQVGRSGRISDGEFLKPVSSRRSKPPPTGGMHSKGGYTARRLLTRRRLERQITARPP